MGPDCPTWVEVSKGIPIPEAVLGGKRPRRHEVLKMEGRDRWGRKDGKGGQKGRENGILQSMQSRAAPGAVMDKKK